MGTLAVKRLTFVRRGAEIDGSQFADRWRSETEEVLSSLPAGCVPGRLVHYVVRPGRSRPAHDGLAVAWFSDPGQADGYESAVRDRRSSVIGAATTVPVEERVVSGAEWLDRRWAEPNAVPALALIGCIEAVTGLTREQFRDYWWDQHRPLADRLVPPDVSPVAYVHNYILDATRSHWAGIGEMYEQSIDAARRRGEWFATGAAAPLLADEDRFLVRSTREVLVADQMVIRTT